MAHAGVSVSGPGQMQGQAQGQGQVQMLPSSGCCRSQQTQRRDRALDQGLQADRGDKEG